MIRKLFINIAFLMLCCHNVNAQNTTSSLLTPYRKLPQPETVTTLKTITKTKASNLSENEMIWGYCDENHSISGLGNNSASTFHCAIFIPDELVNNLKGCQITHIRVAMNSGTNLKSSSVWISKDLQNTPVYTQNTVLEKGWNDITLDTPFEIDGSGFYIGYTTTLSSIDGITQNEMFPIGINSIPTENGLFMKTNNGQWDNYYSNKFGSLMLQCIVTGKLPQYDMLIKNVSERTCVLGGKTTVEATITNKAKEPVSSIDLTYTLDGKTESIKNLTLSPTLQTAESQTLSFEVSSPEESGYHTLQIHIDNVNGQSDEYQADNTANSNLIVLSQMAHRKIVMEEFTGSWCGYCPRGSVAMEKLSEEMPDEYIGIAVHSDEMTAESYNPLLYTVSSFPTATINRTVYCDPYYGTTNYNYGIKDDITEMLSSPSVADISVEATYTDHTQTALNVTSHVTFYLNSSNNPYEMAYVLTEDGIIGLQSNYYSGATNLPSDLAHLSHESEYITDFEFNDVARGIYDCMGIAGSLEGELYDNEEKTHSYTISIPNTVVNKNNLKLTALLINTETGEIINADQIALKGIHTTDIANTSAPFQTTIETGINEINIKASTGETLTAQLYSCNGSLLNSVSFQAQTSLPTSGLKGVYIIRITDDKNVIVRKINL